MDIKSFRKKPVVIQAVQFVSPNSVGDILDWINTPTELTASFTNGTLNIGTLEGVLTVSPGDWIIKGVQGEFYPCKPEIFEKTYDSVED